MAAPLKHGSCEAPTYLTWKGMKSRCDNPNAVNYAKYGGRGIAYDTRWADYREFVADMGLRPTGHTLDREDNAGDYTKSNCRWATAKEQNNNKRTNRILRYAGRALTVAQWADEMGLSFRTIQSRINKYGWSTERALLTPVRGATCSTS